MSLDDLNPSIVQPLPFLQGEIHRIDGGDVFAISYEYGADHEFGPCGCGEIPGAPPQPGDDCLIYAPEVGGMSGAAWIVSYSPSVIRLPGWDVGDLKANVAAAASATDDWVPALGGEFALATYAELGAFCGTRFGALTNGSGGAGTTHFRVPDLGGRALYGKGVHADVDSVGEHDGVAAASRTPKHHLTVDEMPGHTHGMNMTKGLNVAGAGGGSNGYLWHDAGSLATSSSGEDDPHDHGFFVANYLIKT